MIREDKVFKETLLALLKESLRNESHIGEEVRALAADANGGDHFYSKLLALFIHAHFDEEEAEKHWQGIIENQRERADSLKQAGCIHLAVLDYFTRVTEYLNSPILVEHRFFKHIEKLVLTDHLTKLCNRRYFDISLSKEMRRAVRYQKALSVAMLDLDDFKKVNDKYGHPFGDLVLENFAGALEHSTRQEDIVCRYGGEEFVLLCPEINASGAMCLLARIRENIKGNPFFAEKGITFSAGVACYPQHLHDENPLSIVLAADQALYQAKRTGKDKAVEYSPDEQENPELRKFRWTIRYALGGRVLKNCTTHSVSKDMVRLEAEEPIQINDTLLLTITKDEDSPGEEICHIKANVVLAQRINNERFSYDLNIQASDQAELAIFDTIKQNSHFFGDYI